MRKQDGQLCRECTPLAKRLSFLQVIRRLTSHQRCKSELAGAPMKNEPVFGPLTFVIGKPAGSAADQRPLLERENLADDVGEGLYSSVSFVVV